MGWVKFGPPQMLDYGLGQVWAVSNAWPKPALGPKSIQVVFFIFIQ